MTRDCKRAPAALLGLLHGIQIRIRGGVLYPISAPGHFGFSAANGGIEVARALRYFSAGSNGRAASAVGQQDSHLGRARAQCLLLRHEMIHGVQGLAQSATKGYSQGFVCWAQPIRGFTTTSTAHQSLPQTAAVPQRRGNNQDGMPRHVQPTSPLSSQGQNHADSGGRALSAGDQLTAEGSEPREGSGTGGMLAMSVQSRHWRRG